MFHTNTNTMNKNEILQSLLTIKFDKDMESKLRETIGQTMSLVVLSDSIKNDICHPNLIALVSQIAPICYKIGDKVFLKGETKGEYEFIGDDMDFQPATELYDMTEEMKTGDSYTFYSSTVEHFPLATCGEMITVKNFLDNLK